MPKLVYQDSDGIERALHLDDSPVLVGRSSECQIRSSDAKVSRRHARIVWDGGYFIEDLGSSNGVFVGAERVQRAPIRPGDVVVCGSLVLRLLPETAPRQASRPQDGTQPTNPNPPQRSAPASKRAAPRTPIPEPVVEAPVADGFSAEDLENERTRRRQVEQLLAEADKRISAAEARAVILEAGSKETDRLKRKIEQLDAELRHLRGGSSGPGDTMEDPPAGRSSTRSAEDTASVPLDSQMFDDAAELQDILAEARACLRSAQDEARALTAPSESVGLVQESIEQARERLEAARAQLKGLLSRIGIG